MSARTACEFCRKPASYPMCKACGVSYDRYSHDEASIMGALMWAARRARRYAAKEATKNARAISSLAREAARLRRTIQRQMEALRYGGNP